MAYHSSITSGSLVPRIYSDFRGVDFSNKDVSLTRSPDSLNMYKDYKNDLGKTIETRPSIELLETYDNTIFGLFFYKDQNDNEHTIVHSGTKLYIDNVEKFVGMKTARSQSFVYGHTFFIKDGLNYLEYDGTTLKEVEGTIPVVKYASTPSGKGTNGNKSNLLSPYVYYQFIGDGESKDYYLAEKIDTSYIPEITNLETGEIMPVSSYTWDNSGTGDKGVIHFTEAPAKPDEQKDTIKIKIKMDSDQISEERRKITHSTILAQFDDHIFVSGNSDYPNAIFYSEDINGENDPRYFSTSSWIHDGIDLAAIKGLVAGNNTLWSFKESNDANNTIFYHVPYETTENNLLKKQYAPYNSNIATGCESTAINFSDDIIFFSNRGMEGISGDIDSEKIISHRSSFVDSKLLNETNYKKMLLEEWEGYLLVIIDNKVYLADSRELVTNNDHNEYEWFYWELEKNITCTQVKNGVLYLGTNYGKIYSLTDVSDDREIESYWCTPEDSFKVPQYCKTTNKRGCTITMEGEAITVSTKTDNREFETINTYQNTKGYVVSRIKKKKWKTIQLKLSSTKPFGIYAVTLESFVGGYVKR